MHSQKSCQLFHVHPVKRNLTLGLIPGYRDMKRKVATTALSRQASSYFNVLN